MTHRCRSCGYDLSGLLRPHGGASCPECATAYPGPSPEPAGGRWVAVFVVMLLPVPFAIAAGTAALVAAIRLEVHAIHPTAFALLAGFATGIGAMRAILEFFRRTNRRLECAGVAEKLYVPMIVLTLVSAPLLSVLALLAVFRGGGILP